MGNSSSQGRLPETESRTRKGRLIQDEDNFTGAANECDSHQRHLNPPGTSSLAGEPLTGNVSLRATHSLQTAPAPGIPNPSQWPRHSAVSTLTPKLRSTSPGRGEPQYPEEFQAAGQRSELAGRRQETRQAGGREGDMAGAERPEGWELVW